MIWPVLLVVYLIGIIPFGALFLRTGLWGWVHETNDAVLLAFFWPLVAFVMVPIFWAIHAIGAAVGRLAGRAS